VFMLRIDLRSDPSSLGLSYIPLLQFDDIPFRIGDIGESDPPCPFNLTRDHLPNGAPPFGKDHLIRLSHIVNAKGKVSKAGLVWPGSDSFELGRVLEDLKRRPLITVTWQTEVRATNVCSVYTGGTIEPLAFEIALWRNGLAAKDLNIKGSKASPIIGN
jgi:hypothetical protein